MPGRLEFDLGFGRTGGPREDSEPMRLLVLGDFSGKAAADRQPLATRPTQRVDIDNLDDVMRRLRPRLTVPAGEIEFEQIDDFHPDRLYARLDLFQGLRQTRANPPAPTTIRSAACWANRPSPVRRPPPDPRPASTR